MAWIGPGEQGRGGSAMSRSSLPPSPTPASFVGDMRAEPTDDPFTELLSTLIGASGALAMQSRRVGAAATMPPAVAATMHEPVQSDGPAGNRLAHAIAAGRDAILAFTRRSRH